MLRCACCQGYLNQIEDLKAQVAWLKDELGLSDDAQDLERYRNLIGSRGWSEPKMLRRLHRAKGRLVLNEQLEEEVEHHGDADLVDGSRLVDAMIMRLRRRLPKDAIETVWGRGYRMTSVGLAYADERMSLRLVS